MLKFSFIAYTNPLPCLIKYLIYSSSEPSRNSKRFLPSGGIILRMNTAINVRFLSFLGWLSLIIYISRKKNERERESEIFFKKSKLSLRIYGVCSAGESYLFEEQRETSSD